MKKRSLLSRPVLVAALMLSGSAGVIAQAPASSLRLSASEADGSYSLSAPGIAAPVFRAAAAAKVNGKWLHAGDYPNHSVATSVETGELGAAQATILRYSGRPGAPDLVLKLRAYTDRPFGDIELSATNTTAAPVEVQCLRLLEIRNSSGNKSAANSLIDLGAAASQDRVLSDSFSEDRPGMQLRDLSDSEKHTHRAVGLQLLYNQQSRQSLLLAALTSDRFLSVLRLKMGAGAAIASYEVDSTGTTELLEENSLEHSGGDDRVELSLPLAPGATLASERMLVSVAIDYHEQLETYARLVRDLHHARVSAATPLGWWSWTAYYFGLSEGTALTNADFLAEHLKPLGYTFLHMDEGYQFARGEYGSADATLFPHGIAELERKITGKGLTPGIWTAPFEISERSWVFTHHPEWLVHNAKGAPIHIGLVTDGLDHLYALDTTHPGAQAYLRSTYSTLVNQWGIRYIKMDFMEDSAVEGVYHQPHTTALEAQRIGIRTIREAVGEDVLLDKDGCEMLNPVGLVDMGRISQDTGHTFSSSKDAAPGIAARYYINRNYYLADPDAFSVSTQTVDDQSWHGGAKPLTLDEAEVSIALSAVSGGLYEIGDDLPTLGEAADRMALVKNRDLIDMARLGHASTPLDLMTWEAADLQPSLFLLKESANQSIVTVFNWSEHERHHTLSRAALGLDASAQYSVSSVLDPSAPTAMLAGGLDVSQPPHSVRIFKMTGGSAVPPVAAATVPSAARAGEPVTLEARAADPANPVLGYTWEFGDGTSAEGASTRHAFTHSGTYSVRLQASGFAAQPSSQTFSITITGTVATKFAPAAKRRLALPQAEPLPAPEP